MSSRSTRRLPLTALAIVVAGGTLVAVAPSDDGARDAEEIARAEATRTLTEDLRGLRVEYVGPAREAEMTVADLRVLTATAIAGDDEDADTDAVRAELQTAAEDLREHAAQLEETAEQPHPTRPQALPVADVDRLYDRLDAVDAQALETAEALRTAAGDPVETALAAIDLRTASLAYAAAGDELPESTDPDAVAAAWRDEVARLADYREAISAAAAHDALRPLAEAHSRVVSPLEDDADRAVAHLEAEDLDAYEQLRSDRLTIDRDRFARELTEATDTAIAEVVIDAELAQQRALALLHEVEQARRAAPGRAGSDV